MSILIKYTETNSIVGVIFNGPFCSKKCPYLEKEKYDKSEGNIPYCSLYGDSKYKEFNTIPKVINMFPRETMCDIELLFALDKTKYRHIKEIIVNKLKSFLSSNNKSHINYINSLKKHEICEMPPSYLFNMCYIFHIDLSELNN